MSTVVLPGPLALLMSADDTLEKARLAIKPDAMTLAEAKQARSYACALENLCREIRETL